MKVKIRFPIYLTGAFLVMSTVFADDTGTRCGHQRGIRRMILGVSTL